MKIGLFGGSFDPIHNAHLFIAEALRVAEDLDRVVFLPSRGGPHRAALSASVDDRAEMIRRAIAANPAFALDLTDASEGASGYTADLLPRLRPHFPGDELYFIAGGDSLVKTQWQRLDEILSMLSAFVIAPRGEVTLDDIEGALSALPATLRAKVRCHDLPRVSASATIVREQIEAGKSVRYLVPEPVWHYILERGLYLQTAGARR